jgi:hypothetical protein
MAGERSRSASLAVLRPLVDLGSRAAATTLRPPAQLVAAAVERSVQLQRRGLERLLDRYPVETYVVEVLEERRVQSAFSTVADSDAAKQLVASFFESGLFDEVVTQLLASPALWRLVEELADSPAVTAAITQQGFGFADQVAQEVRTRSRTADDWLERAAQRLARRNQRAGKESTSGAP